MSWRTNRRTRKPFPIDDNGWKYEVEPDSEDSHPEIQERDNQYHDTVICAGCGKTIFSHQQSYLIEGQQVCEECNRIDNRLEREERARQQAQATVVLAYSSGSSGKHRGGSPSCSKCGHVYGPGESHEDHWRLHPD